MKPLQEHTASARFRTELVGDLAIELPPGRDARETRRVHHRFVVGITRTDHAARPDHSAKFSKRRHWVCQVLQHLMRVGGVEAVVTEG